MPHLRFSRILPLCLLVAWPALSLERARETVIEDSPGRLVLEVEAPSPVVEDGPYGSEVRIPGFEQPSATGAPALPWYGFQVATGSRTPSVSFEALEWVEVPLTRELSGVPRWINTRQSEPARDAALFAAARGIAPRVSDVQLYRGLQLRKISLPAATYAEGSGRVRVLKKFRVTATFAGPSSAPAVGVRPWLVQADVKNPNGGQYLVSLPRRPLRRSAAAKQFTSGSFIQIKIGDKILDGFDEDGVYSLTYETLSQIQNGISAVDTGRIRLYAGPQDVLGIPMGGLPASAGNLREIPIQIVEGTTGTNPNGTFDAGDRIVFYGHGTSLWKPIVTTTGPVKWQFTHDPYSFENYYYLDWSGSPIGASRLQTIPFVAAPTTVTSAPHYLRGEKDLGTGFCDLSYAFDAETGYAWYWYWKQACPSGVNPGFSGDSVTLTSAQLRSASTDTLKERVADSALWFGAFTYGGGSQDDFNVTAASSGPWTYQAIGGIPGAWYRMTSGFASDDRLNIESVQWTGGDRRFEGYTVRYVRRLSWSGAPRRIFPAVAGQRIVYQVDDAVPGLRVLRIQEGVARAILATQSAGSSLLFSDSAGAGEDVQYHLYVNPEALAGSAVSGGSVSALTGVIGDLSSGDNKNPEYLIIAPQALVSEALKLRDYREKTTRSTRWSTAVVRTEDIYREWSGGRLSPVALRDFLRWALNRWGPGGAQGSLKHVVLYGDGHYDYRDIRNGSSNVRQPNHIPPFNWDGNDFNPMSTDDFYAALDSGEVWSENPTLDVSLGRLPFQTSAHAASYREKISRYEDPGTAGEWRSRMLLTGDDDRQGDRASDAAGLHTQQAEGLGNRVLAQDSGMRKEQVYLFDYPRNSSGLKPEATQDLINFYNRGVLLSTFFGHGAYNQLADEVLLKTGDGLARFRNTDKLFLMSIFSCTVGRFDKLVDEGMSEQFLRVGGYGAIAAVSAARESYADDNKNLGYAFVDRLFDATADSIPRPIGEALRLAKNAIGNGTSINKQKYILQGEPVTAIHRPGLGISLDSVPDTLQAQGCDSITGRVAFGSGKGKVNLRILSADLPKTYIHNFYSVDDPVSINVQKPGRILFERTVDYKDSSFSIGYFLPSQVPFGDTAAKFQLFAWDADSLRESAVLVANRRISGTRGSCVVDSDGRGPRISVTGCNTKESGGVDFPDKVKIALPYCLQITVKDTVGGVLSGDGPDEGTTVEVVGSVAPYHPQAGVDDLYSKSYQLTLSNQDLTPGTHLLKVSARDGFGNLGTRQVSLEVTADTALRFIKAFNVPNPMKRGGTTFYFQTTLPVEEGEALVSPNVDRVNFHVRVFNQQGYMVREFRDAVSGETRWDGKDAWGRQLANGVYFYQVSATWGESDGSPQGGRRTSRKQVLVISR